jgi:hypothetical protein
MKSIIFALVLIFSSLSFSQGFKLKSVGKKLIKMRESLKVPAHQLEDPIGKKYGKNWVDRRRLSSTGGKYKTVPMVPEYKNYDFRKGTRYFNNEQRGRRELMIRNGIFYRKQTRQIMKSLNTRNGPQTFVFVMDGNGKIYAELPGRDIHVKNFHHSSFMAGKPVAMAGTLSFNPNGTIASVTTQSGHYRPTKGMIDQVIDRFIQKGVKYPFYVNDMGTTEKYRPFGYWLCCNDPKPMNQIK